MSEKVFKANAPDMAAAVRWGAKHANNLLVVLEIEDGVLTVSGFRDPNLSRAKCDVIQQFDGKEKLSVHSDILSNALKVFKKDQVTFTIDKTDGAGYMVATNGRARFQIPFTGEGTRMKLPDTPAELGTVLTEDFKRAVDDVEGSAASPEDSPALVLTAVNVRFYPTKGVAVLATTNRYRLTIRKVPMTFNPDLDFAGIGNFNVNLSARELKSLLKDVDVDGTMKLLYNAPLENEAAGPKQNVFGISGSHQMALTGVVDGEYIPYDKLVKPEGANKVVFNRKDLQTALSDGKLFLDRGEKRFVLTCSRDSASLSSPDGNFDLDVDFESIEFEDDAEEKVVEVNPDFIIPTITSCRAQTISFEFGDPGRPIMVFDLDENGEKNSDTYNMFVALAARK